MRPIEIRHASERVALGPGGELSGACPLVSACRSRGWRTPAARSTRRSQTILEAATEYQQAGVLTRVKRVWGDGSGSLPESIGLIVVTRPITVERANSH